MSPLLFIFALESLNASIRENIAIKGLRVRGQEYKLLAFTDDLVVIVEDPETLSINLMNTIEQYGLVAGLKINYKKSKIITKNCCLKKLQILKKLTSMEVVKKVKYLGIMLTNKYSSIIQDNYYKILKDIAIELSK